MLSSKKLVNPRHKIATDLLKWCVLATVFGLNACQSSAPDTSSIPSPAPSPSESVSAVQPSPTTEGTSQGGKLLDNFEGKDGSNTLGGWWFTDKDKTPGGGSQVSPPPGKFKRDKGGADGSGESAKITGKVTKNGYISLGTSLDKDSKPVDLSQYKGIEFWAKGDGKEYGLQLQTKSAIKDFNYYDYVFVVKPEWTRYEVRFDQMTQQKADKTVAVPLDEALKQVTSIVWHTYPFDQARESVELAVDDIKLIQ